MSIAYWKGKHLSEEHKINIGISGNGKKHNFTIESKQKLIDSKLKENNPMWKGDKVCYGSLHDWIRWYKPKPKKCECCGREVRLDCANISGEYRRDVNDYEWLCRKCHMKKDGRLNAFVNNAKSLEFRKKLSDERKGKKMWENKKHPWIGKHHSEESKRKNSKSHLGKKLWIKRPNPMLGKHHSKETKLKMSESRKNKNKKDNLK